MFHLPWYLTGSVALTTQVPDEVTLERIVIMLGDQSRTIVGSGAQFIEFYNPIWHIMLDLAASRGELVLADHGRIWVDRSDVEPRLVYKLRIQQAMFFCIFGGLFFGGMGFLLAGASAAITLAFGVFLFFFVGNILVAMFRVPRLLSRVLANA